MQTDHFTLESPRMSETLADENHNGNLSGWQKGKLDLNGASGNTTSHGSNGKSKMKFSNPFAACNFIVTWNGEDVRELLEAIQIARQSQDRFIQDKLIEYILNVPLRNPRPADIPAFVGKPVWAVDKNGRAIIGMPGAEQIVMIEELREQLKRSV